MSSEPPLTLFEKLIFIILAGAFGLYFVAKAVHFCARCLSRLKGKMSIELDKDVYGNEAVTGQLRFQLNKDVEIRRMMVTLIADETTTIKYKSSSWWTLYWEKGTASRIKEAYRDEVILVTDTTLHVGQSDPYEFRFPAPSRLEERDEPYDGIQGTGTLKSKIKWRVEGRVDMPGTDLITKRAVQINLV